MNKNIAIIFCVEKGFLENQAKLLINSFLNFSLDNRIKLFAVSPRKDFYPSQNLELFLKKKNVEHLKLDINLNYTDYPIANKIFACNYIEKYFTNINSIMFVDTDTVFLNPINIKSNSINGCLSVRPVNNKGPGTLGLTDDNDAFWESVFELCGVSLPEATLITSVRQKSIRPYYNAGLIWVNSIAGFFNQWKLDFIKIMDSNLRPFDYLANDKTNFRCIDQVALSITSQRYKNKIELLPENYNYPIIFRPIIKHRENHPKFNELVHVHYHKWFQHPGFLDYVTDDEEKKSEQYLWLKEHLPLLPTIDGPFKC